MILLEAFVLSGLAILSPHELQSLRWTNCILSIVLAGSAYFASTMASSDKTLSEILAPIQMLIASLIIASNAASMTTHYALILSLALVALLRNRRALCFATLTIVVEQSLRSVFLPSSIFIGSYPAHSSAMIEHICWLFVSGAVLLIFCDADEAGAASSGVARNAGVGGAFLPSAVGADGTSGVGGAAATASSSKERTPVISIAADGDIAKVLSEVGARTQKLNKSISNIDGPLRRMVQSINGANRGMLEIKDELSRTSASVIQVTKSSEMHAEKAKAVFQAADEAAYGSQIGAMSTEQTIRNMDRIREQMDSIGQRMDNLLSKSQLMVQVVGFADELALQSKVLSVNAAIEAAKAGDRGEGFSAVAREVKSLANQSKEATRQVRQILKEIQKSIAEVRRSIALGNETVDVASDQCKGTAESIKGLDNSVGTSRDAAEAIMNSSKDQLQGMMQIATAMNDIQTVSDQNAGSIGNLQIEAQKLNTIARDLMGEMNSYKALVDELLIHCAKQPNGGSSDK